MKPLMQRLRLRLFAIALPACLAAAAPASATSYNVTLLDLGGTTTFAQGFDINNRGAFVGTAGDSVDSYGYLVTGSSATVLGGPAGALGTTASGISDGGVVVGSYYTTHQTDADGNVVAGPQTGFILAGGTYTSFAAPGAVETYLRGISADGRFVTGFAYNADSSSTSFIYDRVTSSFTAIASTPSLTIAQGVTNAGLVVGSRIIPGPPATVRESFTFDLASGTYTPYAIAGVDTRYRGINEAGVIDGWYRNTAGVVTGFVGSAASFESFSIAGAVNTYLEGINDAGWLAGSYDDANGVSHAFLAVPVPEPASALLMLLGTGALLLRRRRG